MVEPASPTGVTAPVSVVVSDEQSEVAVDADRWARLAAAAAASEGGIGELALTFVDRAEMASLNAQHMGGDGPTDVLAFPLDAIGGDEAVDADVGPRLLGDVVVCPAVAATQAADHAGTVDDELALLVVHGCLHVFGHDHTGEDDTAIMRARELELLEQHHWAGSAPDGFRQEQA